MALTDRVAAGRHAAATARRRVGFVGQAVGSPRARVAQTKTGLKLAAVGVVAVAAAGLAVVKGAAFAASHPFKTFKFLLLAAILPTYLLHHVTEATTRFAAHAFSAASCSAPTPVPVGGTVGDAAKVGHGVHDFMARPPISGPAMRSLLIDGARTTGQVIGKVLHAFDSTLNGAPVPTELPPPVPSSQIVGFNQAGGCCPMSSSDPGAGPSAGLVSLSTSVSPGDSPEVAAGRAAQAAGFTGNDVVIAIAVAGAESSYQPTETHLNTNGSTDYGEWQINSVHPDVLAIGDWRKVTDNAAMAHAIFADAVRSGRSGWSPWATFNSGRYLSWLPQAQQASSVLSGIAGPLADLPPPRFSARAIAAPCSPGLGGASIVNFRPGLPAVEQAIRFGLAQLGKPYEWGATGPNSYDCSGLTQAAYAAAGITIGRVTTAQVLDGIGVPVGSLQRGDLIFPDSGHVEIALGDGTALQAPHTGDVVRISPVPAQLWAVRRVAGVHLTA